MDCVPFLMRDATLQRTTDVAKVFPDRRTDEASSFNWTDLQRLNAGRWFLQVQAAFETTHTTGPPGLALVLDSANLTHPVTRPQDDPFWTAPGLSPRETERIANQSVCSLEQLLKLASYHNSTVVFRLQRPPVDHPCHHSWINDTLQAVRRSGIPQNLVGGPGHSRSAGFSPSPSPKLSLFMFR